MVQKKKTTQTTLSFGVKDKDPSWDHCEKVLDNDGKPLKGKTRCKYCKKVNNGGVHRFKHHLAQTHKDIKPCDVVPKEVKDYFIAYLNKSKDDKMQIDKSMDLDQKQEAMVNVLDDTRIETTINTLFKKPNREEVCIAICEWLYVNAIAFNSVNCPFFARMINKIGGFGRGLKPPSYHEVRVTYLKKSVDRVHVNLSKYKNEWVATGCTLMSDGWTDGKGRSITNFLVNSPKGTVFLKSIDTSDIQHSGENLFKLLDEMVEEIGEENVVQVVSDGASNYVSAGRLLMAKRKHLFWSPCAAHCIDLMLHDIGDLALHKGTVELAKTVTSYIYRHAWLMNLMRKHTHRDLTRTGVTRFATNYLNLRSIHLSKVGLRQMFTSTLWQESEYAHKNDGKLVQEIVLSKPNFWLSIITCIKGVLPIVKVLRLVDGDDKPAMGYIYEAMDNAKEQIANNFNNHEPRYKQIWEIIDTRWDKQLHGPLHAAGYYLNPRFHYSPTFHADFEVKQGLLDTIKRFCPTKELRQLVDKQIDMFSSAQGMFGDEMAICTRETKQPALWWKQYGDSTPELKKIAIRVLSATCSATGCERNWSTFQQVHSKKRNRLEQQRMNALVFVKYNLRLEDRQRKRGEKGDQFDPICLEDMDSDDEWICEKEDPVLPQDPSWMDMHECFEVLEHEEETSSRKRKRGPRDLRDPRLCRAGVSGKDKGKRVAIQDSDDEDDILDEDEGGVQERNEDDKDGDSNDDEEEEGQDNDGDDDLAWLDER